MFPFSNLLINLYLANHVTQAYPVLISSQVDIHYNHHRLHILYISCHAACTIWANGDYIIGTVSQPGFHVLLCTTNPGYNHSSIYVPWNSKWFLVSWKYALWKLLLVNLITSLLQDWKYMQNNRHRSSIYDDLIFLYFFFFFGGVLFFEIEIQVRWLL